jgi:hypothetical protein
MSWEEPEFEPVNMSAEIGGYYDDFGGEVPELGSAPRPADRKEPARGSDPGKDRER